MENEIEKYQKMYGFCELEVPQPNVIKLIFDEILNPFYVFQVFIIAFFIW